jgi:hypothetical protein
MKRLLILTAIAGLAFTSPALAATQSARTPSCSTAEAFLRQHAETAHDTLRVVSACNADRSLHMTTLGVVLTAASPAADHGAVVTEMVFGVFYSGGRLHMEFQP